MEKVKFIDCGNISININDIALFYYDTQIGKVYIQPKNGHRFPVDTTMVEIAKQIQTKNIISCLSDNNKYYIQEYEVSLLGILGYSKHPDGFYNFYYTTDGLLTTIYLKAKNKEKD